MEIEKNLKKIEKLGREKEDENWRFRNFLKMCSSKKIDKIVHRLYYEISSQINCQECRNCCKKLILCLDEDDIQRISEFLKISQEEFKNKYLIKDEIEKTKYRIRVKPCPFLKNKNCTIYPVIPENCISYPYLQKKDFISRTINVIGNYSICPIVFNVFERLKEEIWYSDFLYYDDNFMDEEL